MTNFILYTIYNCCALLFILFILKKLPLTVITLMALLLLREPVLVQYCMPATLCCVAPDTLHSPQKHHSCLLHTLSLAPLSVCKQGVCQYES